MWPTEKFLYKKISTSIGGPQLKIKIKLWHTAGLSEKFFIEPDESCPHWLKITLWKELGRLVHKYRIAI